MAISRATWMWCSSIIFHSEIYGFCYTYFVIILSCCCCCCCCFYIWTSICFSSKSTTIKLFLLQMNDDTNHPYSQCDLILNCLLACQLPCLFRSSFDYAQIMRINYFSSNKLHLRTKQMHVPFAGTNTLLFHACEFVYSLFNHSTKMLHGIATKLLNSVNRFIYHTQFTVCIYTIKLHIPLGVPYK